MADDLLGGPIIIRFDGMDADRHELELSGLAHSLSGISRLIAFSSNFAITGELAPRRNHQKVRIVARPPSDGCFIINAYVQFAHHHPMFRDYSIAVAAPLTCTILGYIFLRAAGKKEEMKLLSRALETAIRELGSRDQPTIDRLLGTIDKMAGDLLPAVRRSVASVGESARTLTMGAASGGYKTRIDEADKAAIVSPAGLSVDDERAYRVLISELDMQTGSCHVALASEGGSPRYLARITDPECSLPNNAYVLAMAAQEFLGVRAKATIRDGAIERLFISNYDGRKRGEPDFDLS